jgi:hypothetical protein
MGPATVGRSDGASRARGGKRALGVSFGHAPRWPAGAWLWVVADGHAPRVLGAVFASTHAQAPRLASTL